MKLAYITVRTPLGPAESYLLPEMLALLNHLELLIVPTRPRESIPDRDGELLKSHCLRVPMFSLAVLLKFLLYSVAHPWSILRLSAALIWHTHSFSILIKNLAVLPKGVYLANIFRNRKVNHIHAHWGWTHR